MITLQAATVSQSVDIPGLELLVRGLKMLTICGCTIVGEDAPLTMSSVTCLHIREHEEIKCAPDPPHSAGPGPHAYLCWDSFTAQAQARRLRCARCACAYTQCLR